MHAYTISHMLGIVTSHIVHLGSLICIAGSSGNKKQLIPLEFKHFVFACVHFVTIISDKQGLQILLSGVCKQWTGQLDWITGLDCMH